MKICFFILAFSLFSFNNQEDDILQNIRHKYAEINSNISQYKCITKSKEYDQGEGGDIVSYLYRDSVKLIIDTDYGEMGKQRTEYYYDKNEIIFIYSVHYKYQVPMYDSSFQMSKSVLEENRFYFNNHKMIKWIDENKKDIPVNSTEFKESAAAQLDDSREIRKKNTTTRN
jgi:hypothetical protein